MTEKLRTLLHEQADSVDFALPDLERMASDGDRRLRRRRGTVVCGIAAAVVLASVAATHVGGAGGGDHSAPVVTHPETTARVVAWSKGPVIHAGDRTIDVGHEVRAFVETSAGYVVADTDGVVWSVVDGHATQVGTTDAKHPRLVADPAGSLAAWATTGLDGPGLHTVDQATDEVGSPVAAPNATGVLDALSGSTVYFHDRRGAVALDLSTLDEQVVDPAGPGETFEGHGVVAAHDGTLAMKADGGTLLGASRDHAVLLDQAYGSIGAFSPDGTYYSNDADSPSVWDVGTGKQVPLPGMAGYAFATGYDWLDDRTLVLIAEKGDGDPMVLVTCTIPDGTSCEQVATLGDVDAPDFQLPVGRPIGDD